MPNFKDKFPSRFLKVDDLTRRRTPVRVVRVEEETIGQGKDEKDLWVVYFHGLTKGLVLNATNARMLAEIANSDDTDNWPGTRLVLAQAKVKFQGADKPCIRLDYPEDTAEAPPPHSAEAFDTEL